MKPLTTTQTIARLDAAVRAGGGSGLGRRSFEQSIRPLMVRHGDCWKVHEGIRAPWLYDAREVDHWADYLEKRAALVALGHWPANRPYDLREKAGLVDGALDGDIDHPAFDGPGK